MKWSWRLLTVAGIGVYVHVTFILLLVWAGWMGFAPRHNWGDAFDYIGFILTLFVIVVLHELGHALMARRFGIGTKDITLLPIGGVARLERMPEKPKQELAVALAGPAVNVVLAILILAGLAVGAHFTSWGHMLGGGDGFFFRLVVVNIFLAAFNMLPAFPMDGGRVLRALLAIRMNYVRATRIAASIGQGMALLLGLAGLLGALGGVMNPFLILIAVFVWMGAAQEASMVEMKSALGATRVDQVMITDFRTLSPDDTLARSVEFLLAGYQQDFPVVRDGRMAGILTRAALVDGLAKLGANMPVADAMEKEFAIVHPHESAESVFMRMQSSGHHLLPVLADEHLLGILTIENVGEFLMVQAALHQDQDGRRLGQFSERHAT
jgi:Zn-dependent protease